MAMMADSKARKRSHQHATKRETSQRDRGSTVTRLDVAAVACRVEISTRPSDKSNAVIST